MQYGDVKIEAEVVEKYLGFDPANENVTKPELPKAAVRGTNMHVPQREADLLHLWHKVLCTIFQHDHCVKKDFVATDPQPEMCSITTKLRVQRRKRRQGWN